MLQEITPVLSNLISKVHQHNHSLASNPNSLAPFAVFCTLANQNGASSQFSSWSILAHGWTKNTTTPATCSCVKFKNMNHNVVRQTCYAFSHLTLLDYCILFSTLYSIPTPSILLSTDYQASHSTEKH